MRLLLATLASSLLLGSGQVGVQSVIMTGPNGGASAWAHVHSITIDHTKAGSSNSSAFPMYFGGTFTWLKASGSGGDIQHSTTCCANTETVPADLIFTSDSGCTTMLNWDIPTWVSTTGVIEAWINVPTVSASVDTVIYACTGNPAVTTYQATYTSTWDSNYKAVWHFGDGTTLDLHDSTTNANTCTGVNTPTATAGLLLTGGALNLVAASSQTADCGAGSSLNITTTLSEDVIVRVPSLPTTNVVIASNTGSTGNNGYEIYMHDTTGLDASTFVGQLINASTSLFVPDTLGPAYLANTTYFLFHRYDGGVTNHHSILVNNGLCPSHCDLVQASGIASSANHFFIGNRQAVAGQYFNGIIDEIRVSNINRANDWYTTQYNNMSSPSTFFTVASIR